MRTGTAIFGLVAVMVLGVPGRRAADAVGVEAGRVAVATLDVYDGPDAGAFVIDRLARGSPVAIRGRVGDWLAIEPPAGAFCWIEARVLQEEPDGRAMVLDDGTVIRSGIAGARLPGPPRLALRRGVRVRPIARPPLTTGHGQTRRLWQAIEPPEGVLFYVRAEGIRGPDGGSAALAAADRFSISAGSGTASGRVRRVSVDGTLAAVEPVDSGLPVPPDLAARLRPIEAEHRAALRRPMEAWQLAPVRRRYEDLLATTRDPAGQAALRARLEHVARQEAAAEAARRFRGLVTQSRIRDLQLADLPEEPPTADGAADDLAYDAVGMLQRSNRLVDGTRVFALIGPEGYAVAYLKLPPGLNAEPLVARQVGVRGEVDYNGDLRAQIITVRELDALSAAP